jgi:hypothetical protein
VSSTELNNKIEILRNAGYRYSYDRELYINRELKKAFSVEFIEDKSPEELQKYIGEGTPATDWQFFFNSPPSEAVRRELLNVLG